MKEFTPALILRHPTVLRTAMRGDLKAALHRFARQWDDGERVRSWQRELRVLRAAGVSPSERWRRLRGQEASMTPDLNWVPWYLTTAGCHARCGCSRPPPGVTPRGA